MNKECFVIFRLQQSLRFADQPDGNIPQHLRISPSNVSNIGYVLLRHDGWE
jgi:hypothetical protein